MNPLPVPDGWQPAFEGQRPPFQEGNEYRFAPGHDLSLTHGVYSDRTIAPIAADVRQQLLNDPDVAYLREPRFADALWRYSMSQARVIRLETWISGMTDEQAAKSDRGQTSPLELLRKWSVDASNKAARLGLDPAGWVKIRKDFKVGNQVDAVQQLVLWRAAAEKKKTAEGNTDEQSD